MKEIEVGDIFEDSWTSESCIVEEVDEVYFYSNAGGDMSRKDGYVWNAELKKWVGLRKPFNRSPQRIEKFLGHRG